MIGIAILGYGVVGSGVAEICRMNQDVIRKRTGRGLDVRHILDIRTFPGDPFADRVTSDREKIMQDPQVSVVVETIGGLTIAYELTKQALKSGKHVVTSNKELVAKHGPELMKMAADHKVSYFFEASVGGGIPIVRPLHKCLAANEITTIAGILNGTTNYMMTRMGSGEIDFDEALAEAQAKGYAEQNPSADIDGIDACRKIAILGSITLGQYINSDDIYCEGISKVRVSDMGYAADLGCKVKLVGRLKMNGEGQADMIVAPMLLPATHPLAMADDVFNAIMVEGNALGEAMFYGRGAGKMPTASAVVADVIECVMHLDRIPHMAPWEIPENTIVKPHAQCQVRALLRLNTALGLQPVVDAFGETSLRTVKARADDEIAVIVGDDNQLTEVMLAEFIDRHADSVISCIRLF